LETTLNLDAPVTDGLIAGSGLYLVRQSANGDELVVVEPNATVASPRVIRLDPAPRGSLRIAQMDDYLLLAEDGLGVRILQLPAHQHDGHHGHAVGRLATVGLFAIEEPIDAVGASLRKIYVATDDHLLEIHADAPSSPLLARRIELKDDVRSLDANDDTVYLLGDEGLRTIELSQGGTSPSSSLQTGVQGNSLLTLGRDFYVASGSGGLQRLEDTSMRMATFVVNVGDNFFNPGGVLNINVGDTVHWAKPATTFSHNVFSCNSLQNGCGGANSTELFSSGPVTSQRFDLFKTFNLVGNNPYVCQNHFNTMQGDVVVSGAGPAAPPGVPDSSGILPPMLVDKLIAGGANLGVQFDTSCPDAVNHDLIYGNGTSLPATLGGTYPLNGSQCTVGASPFAWNATPSAAAGDFLWWILVADDGISVEGSWGKDGAGGERNGTGLNGSSGLCANTDKVLTNTCGQ
jgi:plastocyanin